MAYFYIDLGGLCRQGNSNRKMMKLIYFMLMLMSSLTILAAYAADTPEDVFWRSVSKSDVVEEYRLYIEQYPNGKFVTEAWRRIGRGEARQDEEARRTKPILLIAGRYRDNGDGTVTDATTKLQWMRCAIGQTWSGGVCDGSPETYSLDQARKISTTYSGISDWRLPRIEELRSLVFCGSSASLMWSNGAKCGENFRAPTIVLDAFSNSRSIGYWSATKNDQILGYFSFVNFLNGAVGSDYYLSHYAVRLVRSE